MYGKAGAMAKQDLIVGILEGCPKCWMMPAPGALHLPSCPDRPIEDWETPKQDSHMCEDFDGAIGDCDACVDNRVVNGYCDCFWCATGPERA